MSGTDNVVHVKFGAERRADIALEALITALTETGNLVGDDPALMRAKAARVFDMIRELTDRHLQVPRPQLPPLPLTQEQLAAVHAAIEQACRAGVEAATLAAIESFIAAMHDLCTSALRATAPGKF